MTRLADDFDAIRSAREELAREHERGLSGNDEFSGAVQPGHPEAFMSGHADADLLHAIFGGDADKIEAHVEALGPLDIMFVRCPGIELVRQPDERWRGSVDGNPIGPYDKLPTALGVALSLRDKFSR